jgi:hypothetical protein
MIVEGPKVDLILDNNTSSLTLSSFEYILNKEYGLGSSAAKNDAFKFASVLYSMCYLLAPEMHHDFSIALLNNFVPVVKPRDLNWAQFVLWTIGRAFVPAQSQWNDGNKRDCSLWMYFITSGITLTKEVISK